MFNWFEFRQNAMTSLELQQDQIDEVLETYFQSLDTTIFTEEEKKEIDVSFEAYCLDQRAHELRQRDERLIDGAVVTDSESGLDDPDTCLQVVKRMKGDVPDVDHKVNKVRHHFVRRRAKYIESQHFLDRQKSKALNSISNKFPNIGAEIEGMWKVAALVLTPGEGLAC